MKYKIGLNLIISVAMISFSSCKSEYFDQDAYNTIVKNAFPVEKVDASHDWQTIETSKLSVSVNQKEGATYTFRVYEQDPAKNQSVTVLAEGTVTNGNTCTTSLIHPTVDSTFYVARMDASGYRQVKAVKVSNGSVNASFTSADTKQDKETNDLSYFSWRYVFEDAFPQPGDYDFNDMVLTVTRQIDATDPTTLYLTVSLDALGSTSAMAAAVHINGLDPTNVKSIKATTGKFLFYKYSGIEQIKSDVDYSVAFNGDVVIPLFSDAHYALSRGSNTNGTPVRAYYNTVKDNKSEYYGMGMTEDPARVTYKIQCTSADVAKNITSNTIDAFIITQYNGSYWETHAAPFKKYEVLYRYLNSNFQSAYTDNYPWALKVPGNFKYPTEGTPISNNRNGTLSGAYCTSGHSFGEWAENENKAQDWYSYPSADYVYE